MIRINEKKLLQHTAVTYQHVNLCIQINKQIYVKIKISIFDFHDLFIFSQLITASGDSTSKLWDIESSTPIQTFQGHQADIMSIDISPSEAGNMFVSGVSKRENIK